MTFTEKIKRFLEPVFYARKVFIQSGTEGIFDGLYLISSLYFFEKIGAAIQSNNWNLFENYLIAYGIFMVLYVAFKIRVIHWGWVNIYVAIDTFIANTYLPRFIQSEPNITERIGTGRFISIYKRGKDTWMHIIHEFLASDLALLVASVYGIIRIGFYNPLYSFGIVWVLVVLLISTYYIDKHFTIPARNGRREAETEYSRVLARVFMSKMEYMQNQEFHQEQKRIYSLLDDIKRNNLLIDNSVWGMYIGIRWISFLIRLSVYIFVGKSIFDHTSTFWTFSTYILIVTMIETAMRTTYDTFRKLTREFDYIEQLWSTFDSLAPIKWYDSGSTFSSSGKNIEIRNVSYGYNETKVFEDFSLSLESGKKIALVGASGGWKTTLMKLIAGYLHPESGNISVLGNRLDETALKTYYPHIGYLTQDPGVFDATIRENLVSALPSLQRGVPEGRGDFVSETTEQNPQSSALLQTAPLQKELQEKQLIKALKLAHCDFVFELEKWLDTEIGERGVRLSGGQKQRLAIAKIFLKNPEIILLDEPTSALDSFSEEQITIALDELFRNRTVIIVAHRLQTVKKADDIIVLEQGKVVERGNHESLVAKNGIYNRMLELQSGF